MTLALYEPEHNIVTCRHKEVHAIGLVCCIKRLIDKTMQLRWRILDCVLSNRNAFDGKWSRIHTRWPKQHVGLSHHCWMGRWERKCSSNLQCIILWWMVQRAWICLHVWWEPIFIRWARRLFNVSLYDSDS